MYPLTRIPVALQSTVVLALNTCLFTLGVVLLIIPITIRYDLTAYKDLYFPIYPEGRPTSGSTNAPYFPAHLSTSDNAAQIALGCVAAVYGGFSSVLLYLQCVRPRAGKQSPLENVVGWVAMLIAGGVTTVVAAVAVGLSFGGNDDGSAIDLRSVGYWPWKNMFPTINWSIEGWVCKVNGQLRLPLGTTPQADFAQMCNYARISKWTTLVMLTLGLAVLAIGVLALVEQRGEPSDLRSDAMRDSEKGGKEP